MPQAARSENSIFSISATFLIGFIVLYIRSFISITSILSLPDAIDGVLLIVGLLFLLIHCLINWKVYDYKLIIFAVILLLLLYGYIRSGETAPLTIALVVFAAASIDNTKALVRLWFIVTLSLLLLLACIYALNAIFDPDSLRIRYRTSDGEIIATRFYLFFNHPNMAGAIIMMLCAAYLYLCYDKLKFTHYIFIIVIAIITFILTNSYTSLVITILLPILFYLQKKWHIFQMRVLNIIIALLPLILFVAVYLISGPLFNSNIANLFTGRITLWYISLSNLGLTLFGQSFMETSLIIDGITRYATTLDGFYAAGLCVYGLFFSALFCWIYWRRVRVKDSEFSAQISVLIVLALFGITEVQVIGLAVSFPALIMLSRGIIRGHSITTTQSNESSDNLDSVKPLTAASKDKYQNI